MSAQSGGVRGVECHYKRVQKSYEVENRVADILTGMTVAGLLGPERDQSTENCWCDYLAGTNSCQRRV